MDKATLIGLILAWGCVIYSIGTAQGSSFKAFIDYPSVVIVFGGAVAALFMAFPMKNVLSVGKVLKKGFFPNATEVGPVIAQLVQFAEVARRDGILALEGKADQIEDPFILMGIQMAVDGTDAELMESILRSEMDAVGQRHKTGKAMLDTLNKYAPAFGMIGTLVGLIIMLGNMDDPAAIGPGMAVALLTTLYGAGLSNMLVAPISDKLALYSRREYQVRELIVRGILSIQAGDNPRMLEQKLKTCLPVSERNTPQSKAA
jgi:chemotaxis protein MotA